MARVLLQLHIAISGKGPLERYLLSAKLVDDKGYYCRKKMRNSLAFLLKSFHKAVKFCRNKNYLCDCIRVTIEIAKKNSEKLQIYGSHLQFHSVKK